MKQRGKGPDYSAERCLGSKFGMSAVAPAQDYESEVNIAKNLYWSSGKVHADSIEAQSLVGVVNKDVHLGCH